MSDDEKPKTKSDAMSDEDEEELQRLVKKRKKYLQAKHQLELTRQTWDQAGPIKRFFRRLMGVKKP